MASVGDYLLLCALVASVGGQVPTQICMDVECKSAFESKFTAPSQSSNASVPLFESSAVRAYGERSDLIKYDVSDQILVFGIRLSNVPDMLIAEEPSRENNRGLLYKTAIDIERYDDFILEATANNYDLYQVHYSL